MAQLQAEELVRREAQQEARLLRQRTSELEVGQAIPVSDLSLHRYKSMLVKQRRVPLPSPQNMLWI